MWQGPQGLDSTLRSAPACSRTRTIGSHSGCNLPQCVEGLPTGTTSSRCQRAASLALHVSTVKGPSAMFLGKSGLERERQKCWGQKCF